MKRLAHLSLIALPAPALAHPGPHLHPHDGAGWLWSIAALAGLAALALYAWTRR
ncbi:MAG: hypothetical protein ACLFRU_09720 [Paracoccaceae bacterium]